MSWFDLIVAVVVVAATVHGIRLGALVQVGSFVGFFVGLGIGVALALGFVRHVNQDVVRTIVGLVVVFGCSAAGGVIGRVLGGWGATTVAATMLVAALAGIRVFATGGIGGVHRGAAESFDVSADLQELAQTPVAVVCAGVKSILDLRLTLEYLETHGVAVVGYRTATLPAFYTRDSAFAVDYQLDSAADIARVLQVQSALGLRAGMVVANPIPLEHAMPAARMEQAIAQALQEASAQGVLGKQITPFLLARVSALTGGESLAANIQLVLNNARLAAQIARELPMRHGT